MLDLRFEGYLFFLNEWTIFLGTIILYLIATEIGYQIGKRIKEPHINKLKPHVESIQTSVIGLLALLIGFTFAMSITRYENRKQFLVEEADAIETSFLRSQILEEPYHTQLAALLKQYIDNRLEYLTVGLDSYKLNQALARTNDLQQKMWSIGIEAAKHDQRYEYAALALSSLNELINLHNLRLQAALNQVPETILFLIILVTAFSMALTGYDMGLDKQRNVYITAYLAVLIAAVTIVIIDLDRPGRGMIKENMSSMIRLSEEMKKK